MTPLEILESRHSVRQYTDTKIEQKKRDILNNLVNQINKDSGLNIQMIYDEPKCFQSLLAHYGKFSGVNNYISMVGPKGKDLEEKVGYYGQMLVIKAQEIGLNTCWVASTHGKSAAVINKGEKQAIIISLGYGATQGIPHKDKALEKLAKTNENDPQWYKDGVKGSLLAPTAINQQKFFVELVGEEAKITAPSGMLTKMDLGIVKYNFEYASGHKVS